MKKVSREKLIKINLSLIIIACLAYNLVLLNEHGIFNVTRVEAKESSEFVAAIEIEPVVYEGMTLMQLASQLEKSMRGVLSGNGIYYAKYSIEYGVDPYLALAISSYETGWGSSSLAVSCNNVGGMVAGQTTCSTSRFAKFYSLEEGIEAHIRNIYNMYYAYGMTTPYEMQYRYAGGSTTWAGRVTWFYNYIKNA